MADAAALAAQVAQVAQVAQLAHLREPATIRQRCARVLAAVQRGESAHFTLQRAALPALAARVAALTRQRFPTLKVPYHSRWRHFEAGGVDRKALLDQALQGHAADSVARARIDLTLVSVLLDAGAGPHWAYTETGSGQRFSRSEGLAVASFHAFMAGAFSSDPAQPCRLDAQALQALDAERLAALFQVRPDNPLVGLDGRAALLRRLGQAQRAAGAHLWDRLAPPVQAADVLRALLSDYSAIWPSGQWLGGQPLGDVWPHPAAGDDGWVPFHKLSQWLSYSLLEPLAWGGRPVAGLEQLTGLPEYRNGGLLLDGGVLVPRDAGYAQRTFTPADPWVVEWRALTVVLLDELAEATRQALGPEAATLPLASLLEGGTWAAGRQIAAERRPGGGPPVQVQSDGTVF